ncbi:hypothetical protein QBC39DRAFT_18421 [Podospora conica]|nr:hypothetical protein QBC39DRAFT_18421 [Schizothecium conicum]
MENHSDQALLAWSTFRDQLIHSKSLLLVVCGVLKLVVLYLTIRHDKARNLPKPPPGPVHCPTGLPESQAVRFEDADSEDVDFEDFDFRVYYLKPVDFEDVGFEDVGFEDVDFRGHWWLPTPDFEFDDSLLWWNPTGHVRRRNPVRLKPSWRPHQHQVPPTVGQCLHRQCSSVLAVPFSNTTLSQNITSVFERAPGLRPP